MAQLVKLRLRPHKNILKRSLKLAKTNCVLSLATMAERKTSLENLQADVATARARIAHFKDGIVSREEESHRCGRERAQRRLVVETLVTCAHFFTRTQAESMALENLALTIAANVTHRPDRFIACTTPRKEGVAALSSLLDLSLCVAKQDYDRVMRELENLPLSLGFLIKLEIADDARAFLCVKGAGPNFTLPFNIDELSYILKSVAIHIAKCTCPDHRKNLIPS